MSYTQHAHGGQLQQASRRYNIPLGDWLDLSTGISPFIYPLPTVPDQCWQRLPETNDGLEQAAEQYYGSAHLLPVSGSQEAIQGLPRLFTQQQSVGIIKPAYHSHQQAWQNAGHKIIPLTTDQVAEKIDSLDILIVVNPTNPSTESFSKETLGHWHKKLNEHNGTLIIDEAFMDATPTLSMLEKTPQKGLIVLRSIGKFFGLAGIRLGFVWAEDHLLEQLAAQQNDWSVSHPARWAGKLALQDTPWQSHQRILLKQHAKRLALILENTLNEKHQKRGGVYLIKSTLLFSYIVFPHAKVVHEALAQQGILTRYFESPPALRFGLPENDKEFQRLENALMSIDVK